MKHMANFDNWWYFPIEMPLAQDGNGPAKLGADATSMTYEVWDRLLSTHASFDNLPAAIVCATEKNAALAPPADISAALEAKLDEAFKAGVEAMRKEAKEAAYNWYHHIGKGDVRDEIDAIQIPERTNDP